MNRSPRRGLHSPIPCSGGGTRSHVSTVTVPPDEATVVVVYTFHPAPPSPGLPPGPPATFVPLSTEQRQQVRQALVDAGIPTDAISVDTVQAFSPSDVLFKVKMAPDAVASTGRKVIDTVRAVAGTPQQNGVFYSTRDCSTALAPARPAALEKAEQRAQAMAAAASVTAGPVVDLDETTLVAGAPGADPCLPEQLGPGRGSLALQPLDAPFEEVKLPLRFSVTYGLSFPPGPSTVTTVGSASLKEKPDEAYVGLLVNPPVPGPGPRDLSRQQREAIVSKVSALGIDRDHVKFPDSQPGGPVAVRVEVDLAQLPKVGDDLAAAVQEVAPVTSRGVVFGSSRCPELLARARRAAVDDARAKAGSMAAASGLKLGEIRSLAEGLPSPYGNPDPCDEDGPVSFGSCGTPLKSFDSRPEAEFRVSLQVGFTARS